MARISDGWTNFLKGLGSTSVGSAVTKLYSATVPGTGSSQWRALYETDWLAKRIVETFPEEALRKEPTILDETEAEVDRIEAEFARLNGSDLYPQGLLAQALFQGRALGGAVLLLGFKYGSPAKPAPEPGPRSELAWLDACPWEWLSIVSRETDQNSPRYGLPALLRVNGPHTRAGLVIHASRLIYCAGAPRLAYESHEINPWDSVLRAVYDIMQRYGLSWEGASLLLQEASIGVFKMHGLVDLLSSRDEDAVRGRMQLMSEGRSVARTIFLDSEGGEEFSRTDVSFTGLSSVLELLERQISGAAKIPATKLFGRSPGGLNATGESDIRLFYDDVAVYRNQAVAPAVTRLYSLIAGRPIELEFPALWEVSELERAEIRAKNTESDGKLYDLGVVQPVDILTSRSADGSLGVEVKDLAKSIKRLESMPEPTAPDEDETTEPNAGPEA
jgi:uncharacterized protein